MKKYSLIFKVFLIFLSICVLFLGVYYLLYPMLLCDAISNQRSSKQFLLQHPIGSSNRSTQPEFLNAITVPLFESGAAKPLIVACHVGDMEAVKTLLEQGANPNEVCGFSAIEAVYSSPKKENRLDLAKLLIEYQADVTLYVGYWNPVFLEIQYIEDERTWENICFLIEQGCSTVDFYGNTLLHRAIICDSFDTAKKLIENEMVDLNGKNQDGNTALIIAARDGEIEMVKFLLDQGCDRTLTNDQNQTAYDCAVGNGFTEIAELLKQ